MTDKIKKNKFDKAWLDRQRNDIHVKNARIHGFRSRAAYKLIEIEEQDKIFANAKLIVDLGCAPGSWSQVALSNVAAAGKVIGVDLLDIEPLYQLDFIQGDFTEDAVLKQLIELLNHQPADLILSDMSPNLSGIKMVDQSKLSYLVELVLDFAEHHLREGGTCVIKVFHGGEFDSLVKLARTLFQQVHIRKPDASRSKSSEIYLVCKNKNATIK